MIYTAEFGSDIKYDSDQAILLFIQVLIIKKLTFQKLKTIGKLFDIGIVF